MPAAASLPPPLVVAIVRCRSHLAGNSRFFAFWVVGHWFFFAVAGHSWVIIVCRHFPPPYADVCRRPPPTLGFVFSVFFRTTADSWTLYRRLLKPILVRQSTSPTPVDVAIHLCFNARSSATLQHPLTGRATGTHRKNCDTCSRGSPLAGRKIVTVVEREKEKKKKKKKKLRRVEWKRIGNEQNRKSGSVFGQKV